MTQQNLNVLCSAGLEPMVAGLLPILAVVTVRLCPFTCLTPLPFFHHSLLCLFLSLDSNSCVGAHRKPDTLRTPILNQVLC